MNLTNKVSLRHVFLCAMLFAVWGLASTRVAAQACAGAKIYNYSSINGALLSPPTGYFYDALTGTTGANNTTVGNMGSAFNSPNFLGIENGEFNFFDPVNMTIEAYNWATGVKVWEGTNMSIQPTPVVAAWVGPRAGETVKGNPNFIDVNDDDLVFKDPDGSLSSYYNFSAGVTTCYGTGGFPFPIKLYDPTWTTFSGGGPVDGQAPTSANILSIEDNVIFVAGTDGKVHRYFYLTGTYWAGITHSTLTFNTGGPLVGVNILDAVKNLVPGVTFLGTTALGHSFFVASTNSIELYDINNGFHWSAYTTTALSDPPGGQVFNYAGMPLATAIADPGFIGVGDLDINFIDAAGQMEWYNSLGVGFYESAMGVLYPGPPNPLAGQKYNAPTILGSANDALLYKQPDGSLAWYNVLTDTYWADPSWTTFTGGALNSQAPTVANTYGMDEYWIMGLGTDGSLTGYDICTGTEAVDVWAATTFTGGGPLNGKSLADAINNNIPGVTYLETVGNGQLIFAICTSPEVETTKRVIAAVPNANGVTHNVTYEVKVSNAGPVDIDRIQIFDSVAAQLGCTFVRYVPNSAILGQWGLTIPLAPTLATVNPAFNGTTDIRLLNPSAAAQMATLPTSSTWIWNTISVWYTVEVDPTCGGTCAATPTPGFLLNQARGYGAKRGATAPLKPDEADQDYSDDGFWDSADFSPAAPQPPAVPTAVQSLYIENDWWPGSALPASVKGNSVIPKRDDPTPLLFPGVTTTKSLVGSMVDPNDPNYALAEWEITLTNTGTTDLTNLVLTDNILAQIGCAYVASAPMAVAPAIYAPGTTATTNPTTNAGFNGGSSINVLNGTSGLLKRCEKVTVRFTVRIDPNCMPAPSLANTAMGGASGQNCTPGAPAGATPLGGANAPGAPAAPAGPVCTTQVIAPKASLPKPGGPVVINPATGMPVLDPVTGLPIPAINVPLISTVKSAISYVPQVDPAVPGTAHLTLRFGIKNTGNVPLTNLGIIDPLATQFGCAFLNVVTPPTIFSSTAATAPTPNAGYNGSGNLLNGTTGSLLPNQEVFVEVVVAVNPNCVGAPMPQTNSAIGQGSGPGSVASPAFPGGIPVVVTDVSDAGPTFESNNGNASQNDPNVLNMPLIGASKAVVNVVPATAAFPQGHVFATFELTVKNRGNVPLTNLTLVDAVGAQLGCAYVGIAPGGAPAITASTAVTNPTLMPGFTGMGANAIFNGTTGNLMPNQSVTIRFTGVMDPNCGTCSTTSITNQATVSGTGTGILGATITVTDLSDSGLDAESFNTGEPGDSPSNSNNPTPVYLPSVMSAMSMEGFECPYDNKCNANSLVQMRIRVKNVGNTTLSAVQVNQALAANLGSAFVRVMPGTLTYLPSLSTAVLLPPVVNPAYNGTGNMFTSAARLLPCQELVIGFVVEVNPNAAGAANNLTTQATITGTSDVSNNAGSVAVTDLTDAGRVTESDNAAFGAGFDSPTPLNLPRITTNPAPLTVNACDNWEAAVQTWLNAGAGGVLANGANTITCIVNDYFDNTATPGWVNTGCGLNQYRDVRFKAKYTDAWGNMSELCWCARVTIQDNQPPTFDMQPMNKSVDCGATGATAAVQLWLSEGGGAWAHACGSDITWTNNYSGSLPACNTPRTVVFTATDGCNRSATASATLTVTDSGAPVIAGVPANSTVTCATSFPAMPTVTATDACGAATLASTARVENMSSRLSGSQEVPARATSATGSLTASLSATGLLTLNGTYSGLTTPLTVSHLHIAAAGANGPVAIDLIPSVITAGSTSGTINGSVQLTPAQVTSLVAGSMYINLHTSTFPGGEIRGQLGGCARLVRNWSATDACGNSTSASQTVTVSDATAPAITGVPANTTITCPDVPSFAAPSATDACGAVAMYFADVTNGGPCPAGYTITRTWTAYDMCGNSSTATSRITVNAPVAPSVVSISCPANISLTATTGATTAVATFATPSATTTCTATGAVTVAQISGPASGAAFPVGATQVCFRATDACGASTSCCFTVTVTGSTVNPPSSTVSVNCPANMTMTAPSGATGMAVNFTAPTATTTCTQTGTLSTTQIAGPASGANFPVGTTQVCFRVTDACGNSNSCCFNVTVTAGNAPSSILNATPPANQTIACGGALNWATPVTSTTCAGGVVNVTSADSQTGSACSGLTYTRTWTATDACGNAKTVSATIYQSPDNVAPTFTSLPPLDQMINCGTPIPYGTATASDNCASATTSYTVSNNGATACNTVNGITYGFDLYVTWTATDGCGNTATSVRNIWVLPGTNIAFLSKPVDKQISCSQSPVFEQPMPKSFVADIVDITFVDDAQLDACGAGTVTRTWTAVDANGNTCKAEQTVTIMPDHEKPAITLPVSFVSADCQGNVPTVTPVVSDNCTNNSELVVTHTDVQNGNTIERTYQVADACGNINAAVLTIALTDVEAPVFAALAAQKEVACDATIVFDTPTVQDNCTVATLTHVDQVQTGACTDTHTRTWTATDAAGNTSVVKQTVLVTDKQAPVFAGVLTDKTVACADDVQFDTPVATDLCHTVSMYFNNASTTPVCGNSGFSITRTWTANDGCNNLAQVAQTITVAEDTEVPVIVSNTSVQLEATLAQIAAWTPTQLVVSDNCGNPTVTTQLVQVDQCNYLVTYTVTDACANVTTAQQALKVIDGPCVVSGTEDLQFIGMNLFPNPTVSNLTLELPSTVDLQNLRYGIYDAYGRLTLENTVIGYNTVINVQTLSQGAYFLKLSNENASVVKGFVKISE